MEERKSFEPSLMVSSQQIYLFFCTKKGRIVSDGRKERVEAPVGQWKQLEGGLHKRVLISLNRWRLYHLLTLVLNLL